MSFNLNGISERELLYHLLQGLKIVKHNLERYPELIQLENVVFTFSTKKVTESSSKVFALVGFEKSKTKEFSEISTSKYSFKKANVTNFKPSKFKWRDTGVTIQLEFASYLMKQIGDKVLASRYTGVELSEITVKKSFSIKKSKNGLLEFKLFKEFVDVSSNLKKSKTTINSFEVKFRLQNQKIDKEQIIV